MWYPSQPLFGLSHNAKETNVTYKLRHAEGYLYIVPGGATTECRATFKHSPNEPAHLARQWMKERGIIVCTLIVGFIYLVARLARQWIERGIIDMRAKRAGSFGAWFKVALYSAV